MATLPPRSVAAPTASGEFVTTVASTKNGPNNCTKPEGKIVINEIESQGGSPDDWVELKNVGDAAIDLSGYVLTDNAPTDPTHRQVLPAGTVVEPGAYLVVDTTFGLGGADSAILHAADGTTIVDEYSWTAHASTSYGRCPDGTGEFATTSEPTKGTANVCPEAPAATWSSTR